MTKRPRGHLIYGYGGLMAACPLCLFEKGMTKRLMAFGYGLGIVSQTVPDDVAQRLFVLCPEHSRDVKAAIVYIQSQVKRAEAQLAETPKVQPS